MFNRFTAIIAGILTSFIVVGITAANNPLMFPSTPDPELVAQVLDQNPTHDISSDQCEVTKPKRKLNPLPDLSQLTEDSTVLVQPRNGGLKYWVPTKYSELTDDDIEFFFQGTLLAKRGSTGVIIAKPEISVQDVEDAYRVFDPKNWRAPEYEDVVYVLESESKENKWQERQHFLLQDVQPNSKVVFQGKLYTFEVHKQDPSLVALAETDQIVAKVTDIHSSIHKDDIVKLVVEFQDGQTSSITGSYNHPFFVKNLKIYLDMGKLEQGMQLVTTDGSLATVQEVIYEQGEVEMFNLTVDYAQNFFVSTDNPDLPGLLVHNTGKKSQGCNEISKGRLKIDPNGSFSQSEINAAYYMAAQGKKVELRSPVGTRAGGGTSDLLVDGVRYDVYTPKTSNPDRIISAIAKKNSQTEGVVLDLSNSSVTREQLGNILGRVNGSGATNISDIVIMGK